MDKNKKNTKKHYRKFGNRIFSVVKSVPTPDYLLIEKIKDVTEKENNVKPEAKNQEEQN